MVKFINIIRMSGTLHVCPALHDTADEAKKALDEILGNYKTPHLKYVTAPIAIEFEDKDDRRPA